MVFRAVSHDLRYLVSIAGYAQGIQCGVMKEPEKSGGDYSLGKPEVTKSGRGMLTNFKDG